MFILAYFLSCGTVYLIALLSLTALARKQPGWGEPRNSLWRFSGLAVFTSLMGLTVFIMNSAGLELFTLGQTSRFSIPGDYLEKGPVGWLVMALAVIGILSPGLLAVRFWLINR
jgi:hypothetical protein